MGAMRRLASLCCQDIKRGTALLLGFPISHSNLVRPVSSTGTMGFHGGMRGRLTRGLLTNVHPGTSSRQKKRFSTGTTASRD